MNSLGIQFGVFCLLIFSRAPLKYVVINFDKSKSPLKMAIVVLSLCGVFYRLLRCIKVVIIVVVY